MESTSWNHEVEFDTIADVLEDRAKHSATQKFGIFPESTLNFCDFNQKTDHLAAGLQNFGIEEGDRICIMSYNRPEMVELFFACSKIGAIFVPINVSFVGQDLTYLISDADPELIIIDEECIDSYEDIRSEIDVEIEITLSSKHDGYHDMETVYLSNEFDRCYGDLSTPMSIIYTSGTTGLPKGVMLPQGSYLTVGSELTNRIIKPGEDDILHMTQPFFHIFAQIVIMESLISSTPFALEKWFSKSKFWEQVNDKNATIIHLAPSLAEILLEDSEEIDNHVRIAYGIGEELSEQFSEQFSCEVITLYGLTETGGLSLSGTIDDPCKNSIGRPLSYSEVEIVDDNDNPVPINSEGEIIVRPKKPNAMFKQYWKKSKETVDTCQNQWIHTGDIGYQDEDGKYHFSGRMSHFARIKGENVSMAEVERILEQFKKVDDVVCIPVEADIGGEEIMAVIIPKDGVDIEPINIIKFCEGKVAHFKIPRYIKFVSEFPRTETKGSVERHKIDKKSDTWDRRNHYQLDK